MSEQNPVAAPQLPSDWYVGDGKPTPANTPPKSPDRATLPDAPDPRLRQPIAAPEYRVADIDHLNAAANDVWQQAERLAGDQRFTAQHRNEGVQKMLADGVAEVESRFAATMKALTDEQARLEKVAQMTPVPTASEIVQLNYLRDALAIRWKSMTVQEMLSNWQQAIDNGDHVTARIHRDFSGDQFFDSRGKPLAAEQRQRLTAATDDLLASPAQRQARAELPKIDETIRLLKINRAAAISRLQNAYLDERGNLRSKKDGIRRAMLRD